MYDAIIVGARCAGAPTAMLLARQGREVARRNRSRVRLKADTTDWRYRLRFNSGINAGRVGGKCWSAAFIIVPAVK